MKDLGTVEPLKCGDGIKLQSQPVVPAFLLFDRPLFLRGYVPRTRGRYALSLELSRLSIIDNERQQLQRQLLLQAVRWTKAVIAEQELLHLELGLIRIDNPMTCLRRYSIQWIDFNAIE